jgi:hypothetical protein
MPSAFSSREAQRLVVLLGLAGASVGRHYQESDVAHRASPERAFDPLTVGTDRIPFRTYYERLACRTATGHGVRDSYASLVRWNLPTTEVWWAGERIAALPGVFDDDQVRTYTGTADERRFFILLKMSETLELAANATLLPLSDGSVELCGDEVVERLARAAVLLEQTRRLNTEFAALSPDKGLRPHYFMDVFRQYAVHWIPGDVPPSGALDPEAIARDLLLGITPVGYQDRVHLLFPGLLDAERSMLTRLMGRPSLTQKLLNTVDLDPLTLLGMSQEELVAVTVRHPVLAALYQLLSAHARLSGVHLMLTKKFLFVPQREREQQGMGDSGVVSNRRGTTGLDESHLEHLSRSRQHHALATMRRIPARDLDVLSGLARVRAELPPGLPALVGFADDFNGGVRRAPATVRPRAAPGGRIGTVVWPNGVTTDRA